MPGRVSPATSTKIDKPIPNIKWSRFDGEANVVSLIYDMYLAGNSLRKISAELFDGGIKSPPGHDNWSAQYIDNILSSKKYIDIVSLERFFAAC